MNQIQEVVCIHPTCPCAQIPCGQLALFEEGDATLDLGPVSNIFYTSPLAAVLQGDCRDNLTDFAENSVDSIVTDPPYGLKFMGKQWDHGVPGVPFWEAALRVAKPGAYMLAFGGSRTHHRLMCAIEDAGWEIRDVIMWVYSQGFPKSLNFGCRCINAKTEPSSECSVRSLSDQNVSSPESIANQQEKILLNSVSKQGVSAARASSLASSVRLEESGLEGRCDIQEDERELHRTEVRAMPEELSGDEPEGRLCDGTSSGSGDGIEPLSLTNRSGSSREPQHEIQPVLESDTVSKQQRTQESRGRCETCKGVIGREGYGTAIKPAFEPIILCRKPLEKGLTVAQNVMKWGVGGLNIDGCRVETNDGANRARPPRTPNEIMGGGKGLNITASPHNDIGRFPANLIHDGSEEVLACFPNAPGQQGPAGSDSPSNKFGGNIYGKMTRQGERTADKRYTEEGATNFAATPGQRRLDSGSAARFFYCPKSSPKDRGNRPGFKNNHPTVKPIVLLEYLIKLITPPDGTVLDMFAGSGSTLVAAKNLGFKSVGIELSAEYCEIIKTRLEEGEPK